MCHISPIKSYARKLKKCVSLVLVFSLIFSNLGYANSNDKKALQGIIPEVEIDDTLIDDGMFYIPHSAF